jgi:hypothetical protein
MSDEPILLNTEQVKKISSPYLSEGRKKDQWEIIEVRILNETLRSRVRMLSYYKSPTDFEGFHLTSFSTMEFVSQLFIVYGHVLAGLEEKVQEAWMMNCDIDCKKAIRDPDNIQVEMHFKTLRKIKNRMLGHATAHIWDEQGGEFTVSLKALLA